MRERPTCLSFECPGCGFGVVALCTDPRIEPRCHRCRMSPGWHRRPETVASFELDATLIAAGEAPALTCEVA